MAVPVDGQPPDAIDSGVGGMNPDPAMFLGPWFIGFVVLTFMGGVLCTQTTRYFSTFGFESWRLFLLVTTCVLLSCTQWAVLMSVEWDWFIAHFGDWGRFAAVPWQSSASPVLSWTIVFITQLFWASRCYILYNRSKFLFGCLLVGMIATFANFMWQVAVISQVPFNFALMEKLSTSGLLLNLATDLAITGLTLWKIRNGANSYSSASQHGLKRLRNIVVEAAVPPAICGALNLIVFLVLGKKGMVAIGFALLTPSFYVWSMMFTLNSRPAIRRAFHASRHSDGDETLSTNFQFAKLQLSKLKSSDADIQLATANLNLVPEAPQLTKLPVGHVKESSGGGPATRDMRLSKEPADIV